MGIELLVASKIVVEGILSDVGFEELVGTSCVVGKTLVGPSAVVGKLLVGPSSVVGETLVGPSAVVGKLLVGPSSIVGIPLVTSATGGKVSIVCVGIAAKFGTSDGDGGLVVERGADNPAKFVGTSDGDGELVVGGADNSAKFVGTSDGDGGSAVELLGSVDCIFGIVKLLLKELKKLPHRDSLYQVLE
jgi:hypothetical protein